MGNNGLDMTAYWLTIIGALNWGLTGFGWNVVEMLLGSWPIVVNIVYWVIGLGGLWALYTMFRK